MNATEFESLCARVLAADDKPPASLFVGGYDDWRCRARLAHFLCLPQHAQEETGIALFASVVDAPIDESNPEEIEEKVFALQKLSACYRGQKRWNEALRAINAALELSESSDYLYKYILRGELWADRWITLHLSGQTDIALSEADERIAAYEDLPALHNSYLYYAYRFKAQVAAQSQSALAAKDFMRQALAAMEIPAANHQALETAFAAPHENIAWILTEIDRATPSPDTLHWDI